MQPRFLDRTRRVRKRRRMPSRERYLFVCTNRRPDDHPKGSCAARGSEELLKALKGELVKAKLADRFRACGATCLDACELGAAVLVEPEHTLLEGVTAEDAPGIVAALAQGDLATVTKAPERA
jgi:(2Fe-2S) ferredoxin